MSKQTVRAFAALAVAVAACAPDLSDLPCEVDDNCPSGLFCRYSERVGRKTCGAGSDSADAGDDGGMGGGGGGDAGSMGGGTGGGASGANLVITPMVAFGDWSPGQTSPAQVLMVTNLGNSTSGAPVVRLVGADANMFVIQSNTCTTSLSPNEGCSIFMTFKPTALGSRMATLGVGAMPGGIATAGLRGNAVSPVNLVGSPSTWTFPATVQGLQSSAQTFTVTNLGQALSSSLTVALGSGQSSDFRLVMDACSGRTLAWVNSCAIALAFAPGALGARKDTLTISSGSTSIAVVPLVGYGLRPATLTITPSPYTFASTPPNLTAREVFFVKNTGDVSSGPISRTATGPLSLNSTAPNVFTLGSSMSPCGAALPPFATCQLPIAFSPPNTASYMATLGITETSGGSQVLNLSGQGVSPGSLTISPTSFHFGTAPLMSSPVSQSFTITNTIAGSGNRNLQLTTMWGGTNSNAFHIVSDTCNNVQLAAGSTCNITVEFKPSTPAHRGRQTATLSVTGGSPTQGVTVVANLAGVGEAPAQVAPLINSFTFPATLVNTTSAAEVFVFKNNGDATAGMLSIPQATGPFQVVNTTCTGATLNGGASCAVFVTFTPTSSGDSPGGLTVSSAPGSMAMIPLTGPGRDTASLMISETTYSFGDVNVGSFKKQAFTIRNKGGTSAGPLNFNVTGYPAFVRSGGTCIAGAALQAGATCTIEVTFSPTATGPRMESLEVSANPGGTVSTTLTGNGK